MEIASRQPFAASPKTTTDGPAASSGSAIRLYRQTVSRLALDQFFADGPDRRLRAIGNADLAQDVLHVFLDRLVADVQGVGDFLVRQSIGQLLEDFALALGQGTSTSAVNRGVARAPVTRRSSSRVQRLAGGGNADGVDQLLARTTLQQIPLAPRATARAT